MPIIGPEIAAKLLREAAKANQWDVKVFTDGCMINGVGFSGVGDVYLMRVESCCFKVGISGDPRARAKGCTASRGAKHRVFAVFPNAGEECELALHEAFGDTEHVDCPCGCVGEYYNPTSALTRLGIAARRAARWHYRLASRNHPRAYWAPWARRRTNTRRKDGK